MVLYTAEVAETTWDRDPLAYRLVARAFCGALVPTSRPSSNRRRNNRLRTVTATEVGVRAVNSACRAARGLTSAGWRSVVARACCRRIKRILPPPPPALSRPKDARLSKVCTAHQAMVSSDRLSRILAVPAPASSGGPSARPSSSCSRSRPRRGNAVEAAPLVVMPVSVTATEAVGSKRVGPVKLARGCARHEINNITHTSAVMRQKQAVTGIG